MTLLLLAIACAPPDEGDDTATADDVLDLRLEAGTDYPEPGDEGTVLLGPDAVVQPGEEPMICIFGTWNGDDVGVHALATWQNRYGHHLLLMGTTASELDYPDGAIADCSSEGGVSMADLEPLVLATDATVGGEDRDLGIELAEGMAVKLDAGQRWVLQAHYVNTGLEPIRVQDAAVLELLPEDEVETWAAPLVLNADDFSIPPGDAEITFDCGIEADLNILYWTGHMHEWGTRFRLDQQAGDGPATTVYEVPEWDVEYRDAPPVTGYPVGTYLAPAGTTFTTTCAWHNDGTEALGFPEEMCAAVAVAYPQTTAIICDGG